MNQTQTQKTQYQLYREAQRAISDTDRLFMELISHPTNPMTNKDLETLIARHPHRYGRFSGFLGKLKD